ncbi:MAG: hypothetical protein MPF33_09035 [Candidatus Aramenus sp.]|jgi:hypothetical protein|nr:hypothetical protein [Candidatus Aramenus sp.]
MKVCGNGASDGFRFYIGKDFFLLDRGIDVLIKAKGVEVRKSRDTNVEALGKLTEAVRKGYKYAFLDGYLLTYNFGFGFGEFRILKVDLEDENLSRLTHALLDGSLEEREYNLELSKVDWSKLKGYTVTVVDEFSLVSSDVDWNVFSYEAGDLVNCLELDAKVTGEKVSVGSLSFPVKPYSEFVDLSAFITLFSVLRGGYKGEFELDNGKGYLYQPFLAVSIKHVGKTRICGKFRLEEPAYCAFGDGISLYSSIEQSLERAIKDVERLREISGKLKS